MAPQAGRAPLPKDVVHVALSILGVVRWVTRSPSARRKALNASRDLFADVFSTWISKCTDITASTSVLVSFSITPTYCDSIYCVVVPTDACHLLLGRS